MCFAGYEPKAILNDVEYAIWHPASSVLFSAAVSFIVKTVPMRKEADVTRAKEPK